MNLHTLQAFVKVVQTGSFTGAAKAMNTQKAHVSRVIGQLEQSLGVRLLERSTRALSLTEIGREFFERALGILASVEEAQRAVQQTQGEPRGVLKLTCGFEFGSLVVTDWISAYLVRYPQVQVDADFTSRLVDLVHEGFDLAIRVGHLPDSSLAARKLGDLHYHLYAAPAYLKRMGVPEHPDQLLDHDTLAFTGGRRGTEWILQRGTETKPVTVHPRLKGNNVLAIRDAAAAGLGITLLPDIAAQPLLAAARLQRVLTDWAAPPIPVHAVFASARYLTPKVRGFIDLAVSVLQHSPTFPAQAETA